MTKMLLVPGLSLAGMATAFADATPIDVTAVVAQVAAQATPIASIGGAVLLLVVGIYAYKWVRRAL